VCSGCHAAGEDFSWGGGEDGPIRFGLSSYVLDYTAQIKMSTLKAWWSYRHGAAATALQFTMENILSKKIKKKNTRNTEKGHRREFRHCIKA
jgi:hypothetical protein